MNDFHEMLGHFLYDKSQITTLLNMLTATPPDPLVAPSAGGLTIPFPSAYYDKVKMWASGLNLQAPYVSLFAAGEILYAINTSQSRKFIEDISDAVAATKTTVNGTVVNSSLFWCLGLLTVDADLRAKDTPISVPNPQPITASDTIPSIHWPFFSNLFVNSKYLAKAALLCTSGPWSRPPCRVTNSFYPGYEQDAG